MIFTVEYNMYTVYCYAYYLTIKGTKVGNSGLCVTTRDRISKILDKVKFALLVRQLLVSITNANSLL